MSIRSHGVLAQISAVEQSVRLTSRSTRCPLKRYEKWKDIAALSGPPGLRRIAGSRDEALFGEWKGQARIRLSILSGRFLCL
jgi:hypothetical protein